MSLDFHHDDNDLDYLSDWQAPDDDSDPATANLLAERPPAPTVDEQDEADIAWQVRRLRINDTARQRFNALRADNTEPQALDVAAVLRGEVDPVLPTMLTRDDGTSLMYPGLLHWLYGPPGVGKSWVALYASAQLIAKGGHVAYFDWEGNRGLVGDRLKDLGCSADHVEARFHYYRPGNLEPHTEWLAKHAQAEWHLAVFDGAAKALAASGRNEEDNPDVLAWMVAVITPLNDNGCAVLMLDHVTKDRETRDMARGAGAKQGEVSGAAWELRSGQPFNRRSAGHMKLVQRKEREGRTGIDGDCVAELHVEPTRNRGTLFTLRAPTKNAADLARARAMENAYNAVVNWTAANNGEAPSTSKVAGITGNKAKVGELLDELADLGHLQVRKGGAGRPTTWVPLNPYRAPAPEPTPGPLSMLDDWDVAGGD